MKGYPRTSTLGAYQAVATHGGVASADPHGLVVMLMDGALERIAKARGCIRNGARGEKAQFIQAAVRIVDELRCSLDLGAGGPIAANLDDLYDYMSRQLIKANASDRIETLDEVSHLLGEIRSAWIALPADARALRPSPR
jgi:flagellar protein FliS